MVRETGMKKIKKAFPVPTYTFLIIWYCLSLCDIKIKNIILQDILLCCHEWVSCQLKMLRKLYLLFLIYFQLSLCYDYDSDAGYRRKKPRLAKNINRQQVGRDYYNSFRRYQNAFEDVAPGEDRGALAGLDSVNLVQKPEDISSIDSLYLHKRYVF